MVYAHEVKNSDFRGRIFRDTARRLRILMLILGESTTVNTLKKKIRGWDVSLAPKSKVENSKNRLFTIFGPEIPETWKNRLMPAKIAN